MKFQKKKNFLGGGGSGQGGQVGGFRMDGNGKLKLL